MIDLGKRQQSPSKASAPCGRPGAGLQFLLAASQFLVQPGPREGCREKLCQTPGSSTLLPEMRSDENVFLQIKVSQDSPSGGQQTWRWGMPWGWRRSPRGPSSSKSSALHLPPLQQEWQLFPCAPLRLRCPSNGSAFYILPVVKTFLSVGARPLSSSSMSAPT